MIKNLALLITNDLAAAFKNKSLFLILFIPLFAVLSLKLVDRSPGDFGRVNLGIVQNQRYPYSVMNALRSADRAFSLETVISIDEGEALLRERVLDGILVREGGGLELVVLKKEAFKTLAIVSGLTELQRKTEGRNPNWITDIRPLHAGGFQFQSLPTWVLMSILLVSLIILPAQVADEKEKKLLLGLLQTPMRESEWLASKVLTGMALSILAVLLLHVMGLFGAGNAVAYITFIVAGTFCFSSFGVMLGFLCASQSSARTLGVLFYLPLLLPSALSDFSSRLSSIAPLIPSYNLFEPVRAALLEGGRIADFTFDLACLLLIGLAACFITLKLIKKRWLM